MEQKNWRQLATNILKSELARKNINYIELAEKLNSIGVNETQESISCKLKRGTFQFSFFLQCAEAIGINKVNLD